MNFINNINMDLNFPSNQMLNKNLQIVMKKLNAVYILIFKREFKKKL